MHARNSSSCTSMAVRTSLRIVTAHSSGVHIRLATVSVMRTAEIAAAHGLSVLTDCDGSTCRSNCNQLIVATHARPARTGPLELSAEPMECSAATADSLIEHSARANVQLCQRALKRCHRACPHHRESSSGASQFAVFTFFCARVLDRSCSTCASGQRARVIKLFVFMSAHASFMYNVRALNLCQERPWSKLCALTSYRSQARTVHDHTTCAQVVQALRASSRPPRVLDLRGRSASNALLLRSTSARAQPVLGLDGTSAAPTTSARVSWPRHGRHDRHVEHCRPRSRAAWRSESTRLVALASILCAFWGRTHAAQPKNLARPSCSAQFPLILFITDF
jgi:hypothetical protein